jgi:hypothetical protein
MADVGATRSASSPLASAASKRPSDASTSERHPHTLTKIG